MELDDCETVDVNHFYSSLIIHFPQTGQEVGQLQKMAESWSNQNSDFANYSLLYFLFGPNLHRIWSGVSKETFCCCINATVPCWILYAISIWVLGWLGLSNLLTSWNWWSVLKIKQFWMEENVDFHIGRDINSDNRRLVIVYTVDGII